MKKSILAIIIVILFILGFIGWYLLSPLFVDKTVNEALPSTIVSDESKDTQIQPLYEGTFTDADSFHKTSGKVVVIEADGKKYLRFENFVATNGPDLKVYLSTGKQIDDYISLGDLKGNKGEQNYEISQDVNFDKYNNVLIWCEQFSVLFGSAQLN